MVVTRGAWGCPASLPRGWVPARRAGGDMMLASAGLASANLPGMNEGSPRWCGQPNGLGSSTLFGAARRRVDSVEVDVRTCAMPSPQRDGRVDGVEATWSHEDAIAANEDAASPPCEKK